MASPLEIVPPDKPRVISQIACWGSPGGSEVVYALCTDGTLWRGAHDRAVGEPVWRQVPPIEAAPGGQVLGFTYDPPQPTEAPVPAAAPIGEQQW